LNNVLVLGWGNPILGDDSLGVRVAEKLKKMGLPKEIKIECSSSSPFSVVRKMLNYRKVIIVDSLRLPHVKEGKVFKFNLKEFCGSSVIINPHSISLPAAFEIYRTLYPDQVPKEVLVIGVCVGPPKVGEGLSDEIKAKIDEVVELVMKEIGGERNE